MMKSAKLKSMLLSALLFVNCEGESIRNFTKVFNGISAAINGLALGTKWYAKRIATERPIFSHKGYEKIPNTKRKTDVLATVEERLSADHQSEDLSVSTEPGKTDKKYFFQENWPKLFMHCYLNEALWDSWHQGDIDNYVNEEPSKLKNIH